MTDIADDRWLSECFGYPVFRVDGEGSDGAARSVERHASRITRAAYYAKIATGAIGAVRALCDSGFFPVDVNATFVRSATEPVAGGAAPGLTVEEFSPEDEGRILDIAGSCFRFSRFHLDPHVPGRVADGIKRRWVESYVRKERGDTLLVARLDGEPAGFLAALTDRAGDARVARIDLIGVTTDRQGRGIGRALVEAFIDRYSERAETLEAGTQVANLPSVRLYEGAGFRLARSAYVLHRHVGG